MIPVLVDTAATLSAIVLAAVFGAAAAVKFTSVSETAAEFSSLGLGRSRLLPIAVATAEAGAAVALVTRPAVGAVAAAALLVAFTGVVTWALAAGRQVRCGCFGPLSREPVSSVTIARNVVLLALAVLAGGQATLETPDLASTVAVTAGALTIVLIVQLAMTARVLGRIWTVELAGELHVEPHEPTRPGKPKKTNRSDHLVETIERISR